MLYELTFYFRQQSPYKGIKRHYGLDLKKIKGLRSLKHYINQLQITIAVHHHHTLYVHLSHVIKKDYLLTM